MLEFQLATKNAKSFPVSTQERNSNVPFPSRSSCYGIQKVIKRCSKSHQSRTLTSNSCDLYYNGSRKIYSAAWVMIGNSPWNPDTEMPHDKCSNQPVSFIQF
ncbi:hypothetical protein V6N13_087716 [Hibiscus sabdariffa]|uniref:Uncharacterized protein n=1 Tax=Hibiscus sabdariffa TaxID=183260 RepID=A0ABR2FXI9_9ROSI